MVEKKNEGKQFDLKIKPFLFYEYLKQAKILWPDNVVNDFLQFIDKIRGLYGK